MLEIQENGSNTCSRTTTKSKKIRCRSFNLRYLELCRAKNMTPLADIRRNNKDQVTLDFFGDKLGVAEWLLVVNALSCDQLLQTVSICLRKCLSPVLTHIDSERKAKLYKQKPVVYTKFIFSGIVESLSKCIEFNKNLRVLILEGLPLGDTYMESIAKSVSSNTNIKEISFARSNIFDTGCEIICNTIKYLDNIEKLNLSDTGLTSKGAQHVADMIKIQKISRFTAGWQQSLRYRDFDASNIPGLRVILLARNPEIGDNGLSAIVDVLKEDIWVKIIDMENCGLTDRAANILLDCLNGNKFLVDFNVRGNPGISKFLLRSIHEHLNKEDECQQTSEDLIRDFTEGRVNGEDLVKKHKVTIQQLITQLKATSEQLEMERHIRKKAEQLNEKLTAQIIAYESKLSTMTDGIPEGYVFVNSDSLQSIIRERNDLQKLTVVSDQATYIEAKKKDLSPRLKPRSPHALKLNFGLPDDNEVQFMAPLPEPSESPSASERSRTSQMKSTRPLTGQIRKVKSELKYVEQPNRLNSSKKKETKSDYDYGTESDVPRIEMNIGDTVANIGSQQLAYQQSISRRTIQYSSNAQKFIKKHELDEISVSTSRSHGSDAASAESETLRRKEDAVAYQQKGHQKMAIKKSLSTPPIPMEYGQGEGSTNKNPSKTKHRRSPRSLFLGLCDD